MKKTRRKTTPKVETIYHPDFVARCNAARKEFLFGDPATFTERLEAHVNLTLARATEWAEYGQTARLYQGANLQIMRRMPDGLADLIYADPPFNSGRDYFAKDGKKAFVDTWSWSEERQREWDELQKLGRNPVMDTDPQLARCMLGFQLQLGEKTPTLAYLTFMALRIRECRRVMK